MQKKLEVENVKDLSIKDMLKTNRFINLKDDDEGNVLTEHPIYARSRGKDPFKTKEFFSADEFCVWAKKLGCKVRACGPTLIWEDISLDAYLKLAQFSYAFEDVESDTVPFEQSA